MERKNMFCLNLDGETDAYECEDLLLRQIDARMQAEEKEVNARYSKSAFLPIRPIGYSIVAGGFILLASKVIRKISPQSTLASILLWIGLLIVAITLIMIPILRKTNGKRSVSAGEEVDRFYERCARALHVPDKAPRVDVFAYLYETKDGVRKNYYASGAYLGEFTHIFEENGNLCLYCATRVYAVPIASVEEFVRVDEKVLFATWDKETPYNEGKYAPYNIEACGSDEYCMNDYYRIRFTHEGTPYELLIASYDIEPFLKIVPLTGE